MIASLPVAVESLCPVCPMCGWQLPIPPGISMARPVMAAMRVQCGGCKSWVLATFWRVQALETEAPIV